MVHKLGYCQSEKQELKNLFVISTHRVLLHFKNIFNVLLQKTLVAQTNNLNNILHRWDYVALPLNYML